MADNLDYFGDAQLNDPNLRAWDGSFSTLPPGEYEFEITKYERKETKKGLPRLALSLKVVSPGEQFGQNFFHSFMLAGDPGKDAWRGRLLNLAKATGIAVDERGGFYFAHLIGRRFVGTVVHGTYEDIDAQTGLKVEKSSMNVEKERPVDPNKPAAGVLVAAAANAAANGQPGPRVNA